MRLRILTTSISLLCLLGTAVGVLAQTPGAIDQVDSAQQRRALQQSDQPQLQSGDNAPELYPGESQDIGPQSVLAIKPRKTLVEAIADSEFFHTDNVFLDHNYHQSSGVLVSTRANRPCPHALSIGRRPVRPTHWLPRAMV